MSDLVQFETVHEADQTYYSALEDGGTDGTDESDGSDGGDTPGQSSFDVIDDLGYGWTLALEETPSDGSYYYVAGGPPENPFSYVDKTGEAIEAPADAPRDEVPHYTAESDARTAYEKWVAKYGDEYPENPETGEGDAGGESGDWSKWMQVNHVPPWYVDARSHSDGERIQFVVSSTLEDGSPLFLGPDGMPQEEPHIYESQDGVTGALNAYFELEAAGEIPGDLQPTGDRLPSRVLSDLATKAANKKASGGSGPSKKSIALLGAIAVGGGYVAYQSGALEDL